MDKRFRSSLSGYNKNDVHAYIENLLDEKDYEINELKYKIREMGEQLKKLTRENFEMEYDKNEIAETLLKTNDVSKKIIEKTYEEADEIIKKVNIEAKEKEIVIKAKVDEVNRRIEEYLQKAMTKRDRINFETEEARIQLNEINQRSIKSVQRLKEILEIE